MYTTCTFPREAPMAAAAKRKRQTPQRKRLPTKPFDPGVYGQLAALPYGVDGRLVHDLRRTAVRLERAGVLAVGGHETHRPQDGGRVSALCDHVDRGPVGRRGEVGDAARKREADADRPTIRGWKQALSARTAEKLPNSF